MPGRVHVTDEHVAWKAPVATIATQVRNETVLHDGYAPANWVLGTCGLRITGSLPQDHEAEKLNVQEAAHRP